MAESASVAGAGTGENNLRMASRILILIALIFIIDVITPLGLTVWILYFIPLFLTLYWDWPRGPYLVTGVAVILLIVSLFLSPQDVSFFYALLDRLFFTIVLTAAAILIAIHKRDEETLRQSEERYRVLVEWSPDAIAVYNNGSIVYTNPSFSRLFGQEWGEMPTKKEILSIIHAEKESVIRERIAQAEMGATIQVPDVGMLRPDGRLLKADLLLSPISWNKTSAVQIIARIFTEKDPSPSHS